jgi:hypothetical protein
LKVTCLAVDTVGMAKKKPEPPKPMSWSVYKLVS